MNIVNDIINNNNFVIFSKDNCIKCKEIKKIFDEANIKYKCYNIPNDFKNLDDDEIFNIVDHLKTFNNEYPFIFIRNEFILFENVEKLIMFENSSIDDI